MATQENTSDGPALSQEGNVSVQSPISTEQSGGQSPQRRCEMIVERPAGVDPERPHELVVVVPRQNHPNHPAKGK